MTYKVGQGRRKGRNVEMMKREDKEKEKDEKKKSVVRQGFSLK